MYNTETLCVNDKISFILANDILDGEIIHKDYMDKGIVGFVIKLDNNKTLYLKNINLDLYCKY